jgi:hypothetical protein
MNEEFQSLYRQLIDEEIDTTQFLAELKSIANYSDDLLAAIQEQYNRQHWRNLAKLIWAVSSAPERRFTPLLCDLLENHPYDGYMEALADSLLEIADENSVPCITRSLNYRVHGDDGRHFNRALINVLYKIGTPDAIEGIKQANASSDELVRSHAEDFLARTP